METTPSVTISQLPLVLRGAFLPHDETKVGVEFSRPCTPRSRLMSTEASTLQKQGSLSCLRQECYQLKSMSCTKVSFVSVDIPNVCELPTSGGFPTVLYPVVLVITPSRQSKVPWTLG